MTDKLCIPDVVARFRAYHARPENITWGSLHIVLDDGNVDTGSVEFCVSWAEEKGDGEGAELARILLRMSRTQRLRLGAIT